MMNSNTHRLRMIRKPNRRPVASLIRDDSPAAILFDPATLRALASAIADELENREAERRGFMPSLLTTASYIPADLSDLPAVFQ